MNHALLLDLVAGLVRAHPPHGIDAAYVDGFVGRNRDALLAILRDAFPAGRMEPAFARLATEHTLIRVVLLAVETYLAGRGGDGEQLAELVLAIDDHVVYENAVLFPYLRRALPDALDAIDHAREEHELVGEATFALASALRTGRRYEGPAIGLLRHHLAEEELGIVNVGRAAGLEETPVGGPSRLIMARGAIERLGRACPVVGVHRRATDPRGSNYPPLSPVG